MDDAPADLTDDPRRLAMAAREHLRRKFLTARVAVSGANFGIADTGTLCVVESEGNGRMCLTLPQTLITVMGIEKLLPTFSDLEVFLQLLPRSSTGERMNPYTSLWTGVTPGDGPQEFHLILLDNGRTNALADQVGRAALHCIRCSACLNVCPVYERTGGHAYGSVYPGPIGAILTPHADRHHRPRRPELLAALRLLAVRRLLRRLPGEDRHPDHPGRTARPERSTPTGDRTIPGGWDAAMKAAAWVMSDEKRFAAAEKGLAAGRAAGRPEAPDPAPAAADVRLDGQPRPAGPAGTDVPRLVAAQPRADRPDRPPAAAGSHLTSRRQTVLGRIRAALADDGPPAPIPRDYIRRGPHNRAATQVDRTARSTGSSTTRRWSTRSTAADLPAAVDQALAGMASVVIAPGLDPAVARGLRRRTRA